MKHLYQKFIVLCTLGFITLTSVAQNFGNIKNAQLSQANGWGQENERQSGFKSDSTELEGVPEGIFAWHINDRFGDILPAN